jgi:geranylgeranylglycerol-phosphate geranylgeranyltransferase
MNLAGLFRITRPANSIAAGLAAIVAYLIAAGALDPAVVLLFTVVALVTAAGNVINDYYDVEIDRVNRPDRPIPSGQVTLPAARAYAVTLFLAGIFVCLFTNELCITIAVFNSLLLVAYAGWLKRTLLLGNLAVAYLSGSMFLFGGALTGLPGFFHVLPFAIMTFFAMLARELVKDAEDVEGDQASGAATLPFRYGIRATVFLALACAILSTGASLVPFTVWGIPYLAGILLVDAFILVAVLKAVRSQTPDDVKKSGASTLLKLGMFASLIVFTLSVLFL